MSSFNFTTLNVRNLKTNFLFVNDLMLSNDICFLTETWLHEGEIEEFKNLFKEFNAYFQCDINTEESYKLRGRPYGGKCWLVKKHIKVKNVSFINNIVSSFEIDCNSRMLLVGVHIPFDDNTAYRISQYKTNLEFLSSIIDDNQFEMVLIGGDFNSDLSRGKRFM
jgi:hypothetical protein